MPPGSVTYSARCWRWWSLPGCGDQSATATPWPSQAAIPPRPWPIASRRGPLDAELFL